MTDDMTFLELLRKVRDLSLDAYAHQDIPFEKLVEELRPDRSQGGLPLVQVLFNFANTPFARTEFQHLSWTPYEVSRALHNWISVSRSIRWHRGRPIWNSIRICSTARPPNDGWRCIGNSWRRLRNIPTTNRTSVHPYGTGPASDHSGVECDRHAV